MNVLIKSDIEVEAEDETIEEEDDVEVDAVDVVMEYEDEDEEDDVDDDEKMGVELA